MQYDTQRRLTRSSRERMLTGVAGGMAEYFDLDPVVVRLLWVAAAILSGGLAIPAYIVMYMVMPKGDRIGSTGFIPTGPPVSDFDPAMSTEEMPPLSSHAERRAQRQRTAGIILIALGVLFMAQQSGLFWFVQWRYIWPLVLIAVGVGILLRQNSARR
jgi:phage shock protein PspC (stress-responsive transcriptional regulator)